jgi:hypothetical protein
VEASFDSFRAKMAPQRLGSWNVIETRLLRPGRPDPKLQRPYILKYEWPGYGPARAHSRSSSDESGRPHDPHAPGHARDCQINKRGWVAWSSIELPSRAMNAAVFSCVEPGDADALLDSLNA